MSDNHNNQLTVQFKLADSTIKSCTYKRCQWEFSSKNQLHCYLLICQKHCDEIFKVWMTESNLLISFIISQASKTACERYVFQKWHFTALKVSALEVKTEFELYLDIKCFINFIEKECLSQYYLNLKVHES